jgi:hypothetical protein
MDTNTEQQVSSLSLSDDQIGDYLPSIEPEAPVVEETVAEPEVEAPTEEISEEEEETELPEEGEEVPTKDADKEDAPEEEDLDKEVQDTETKGVDKDPKEKESEVKIDYEAEYNKILSPFRANNKEIKVDSVEDALTLMKMGANYNKKMAGLKPNLKLLKMLENHELLDEAKLSYLIDLSKKDPAAITKLVKESGLSKYDIDNNEDTEYKPNTYTVDDAQVDLDSVLGDIQDTPSYQSTMNIISTKWDESSRQAVLENPSLIAVINEHVGDGVYDQVFSIVEKERMMGRLTGLSDLDAYRKVGEMIQAQYGQTKAPVVGTEVTPKTVVAPKVDPKLKARKLAASPSKGTTAKTTNTVFNPLSLSDEDFDKQYSSKYL